MKILFCAYDRPGHIATGPNAWLQRLIPDLRNRYGLDVSTLFIYNGNTEECPTLSYFKSNHLPVFTINGKQIPYMVDQVKAILQIIKINNFSVLVANLVIPAYYTSRYLKPFDIPVIGVLHSNDPFYKSVIDKFIKGNIIDQLTVAVSVSNFINGIAETSNKNVLFKVIPCGTPLTQKSAHRDNESLKVIYAGRLETTQKQILKLTVAFLKASKENPNLEFSIYGSGSQDEEIKSLIADFGHPHKVSFKGSVLPSEIQKVMLNHHVFTLMSDYEGMPIALMEAMACGLVPVCLYEESGINEIISHGTNGFIVQNRHEDYQEQLNVLQEHKEIWDSLSKNAQKIINEKYSTEITHQQWVDLLEPYRHKEIKKISVPNSIKLEGELLYYGDNRKPSARTLLKKQLLENWLNFKLFVRPRARLRSLFKK